MNDSRLNKTIKFEGAGWSEADTSKATDMTNCRVRTEARKELTMLLNDEVRSL